MENKQLKSITTLWRKQFKIMGQRQNKGARGMGTFYKDINGEKNPKPKVR